MQGSGAQKDGSQWRQVASYLDNDDLRWLQGIAERKGISVADAALLTTREAQRDNAWEMERGL